MKGVLGGFRVKYGFFHVWMKGLVWGLGRRFEGITRNFKAVRA